MAISPKTIKFGKEELLASLAPISSILAIIFILFVLILPQVTKIISLTKEIKDKRSTLIMAEQGSKNLQESRKEIVSLEKKIAELEKRLPREIQTTLLIDTLKDITEEAKLKFASIEPLPQRNYEIKGLDEFYLGLPIKVKLNCTFSDLIKFIQKIENSSRLMKISELTIKNNPQNIWEHNVELAISTFAIGKK
jgi:Tfp pilus assembly protein PilO